MTVRAPKDKFGYPEIPYGDEFPSTYPHRAPFFRIDEGNWYYYNATTDAWVMAIGTLTVDDGATEVSPVDKITFDGTYITVTDAGSADATVSFDETQIDHGNIGGLGDDDHTQYMKEKAFGGVAAEVPTHDHSAAAEGGTLTLDHGSDLTGLTDDDHTQYILAAGTRALTADWDAGSFDITAEQLVADTTTINEGVTAGYAFTGNHNIGGAYAVWCQVTHKGNNQDYALAQGSGGDTYLNAKTGQKIWFRINGTDEMQLEDTALTLSSVNLVMSSNDITGVDDIVGNGGSIYSGGSGSGEDLYLDSTTHATKGDIHMNSPVVFPTMTTVQREAHGAHNGMVVYDSTEGALYNYVNGAWAEIGAGGGGGDIGWADVMSLMGA
jgi:hypothetical protein